MEPWDGAASALGSLDLQSHGLIYESLSFESLNARLHFREGVLHAEVNADQPETRTQLQGMATWEASTPDELRADAHLTQVPLSWVQPWVDSSAAILTGTLDAAVEVSGPWRAPVLSGGGIIDTMTAEIPSLGTSFGASGAFDMGRDEVVLRSCVLSDRLGATARVEGALLHEAFRDWNFDVSMVDAPNDLLIMDLPPPRNRRSRGSWSAAAAWMHFSGTIALNCVGRSLRRRPPISNCRWRMVNLKAGARGWRLPQTSP